ncbi:MAG: hypothetical protein ACFFAE_07615 [Candidatus Hodarchaeota archaeon]
MIKKSKYESILFWILAFFVIIYRIMLGCLIIIEGLKFMKPLIAFSGELVLLLNIIIDILNGISIITGATWFLMALTSSLFVLISMFCLQVGFIIMKGW